MCRPLVPAAVVALALWAIVLTVTMAQDTARGQTATPRSEGSVSASPAASPAACLEDALSGRLVAVPNKVTIQLTDEGFDPARIQATNNTDMSVTLVNTGTRPHAFVLEDFGVDVELAPDESETLVLTLKGGDANSHDFYSDAPGDECMQGALIFYI